MVDMSLSFDTHLQGSQYATCDQSKKTPIICAGNNTKRKKQNEQNNNENEKHEEC